jgi:lipopolysaccharide transport protein LptA
MKMKTNKGWKSWRVACLVVLVAAGMWWLPGGARGQAEGGAAETEVEVEVVPLVPPAGAAAPGGDVRPGELNPKPFKRKAEGDPVRITNDGATHFDSEKGVVTYTENVQVFHPNLYIKCDRLVVTMAKDDDDESQGDESGIEKAVATGRTVLIQRLAEDGEVKVAQCRHATYIGATEHMILRIWPQVQEGRNLVIGTSAETIMVLDEKGSLDTRGPSRTELVRGAGE